MLTVWKVRRAVSIAGAVALAVVLTSCDWVGAGEGGGGDNGSEGPTFEVSELAAAGGDGSTRLFWTDPTDDVFENVRITWQPGGSPGETVQAGQEGFTVTGLDNGTAYTFTVRAADLDGELSPGVSVGSTPEAPKWSFVTGAAVTSTPAVASDGSIYIGTRRRHHLWGQRRRYRKVVRTQEQQRPAFRCRLGRQRQSLHRGRRHYLLRS